MIWSVRLLDAASELENTLALIHSRLADIGEIPVDTKSRVEECVSACHRNLGKFQKKLDKVKGSTGSRQAIKMGGYTQKSSTAVAVPIQGKHDHEIEGAV